MNKALMFLMALSLASRDDAPRRVRAGGGIPYRSSLEPFLGFITKARKSRKTWRAIAVSIREQGTSCTAPGVYGFYQRAKRRQKPKSVNGSVNGCVNTKLGFEIKPSAEIETKKPDGRVRWEL